jgi:hypothetical protein
MKKLISLSITLLVANQIYAQQWLGSTTSTNNIYRTGDITVINGHSARVSLGAAWGGSPIWGTGYLGINLRRESSGLWSYLNNGSANDGLAMYASGNNLHFSFKPSTGGFSGTITDADVVNNVKYKMNQNGIFEVLKGDLQVRQNTVTLGAASGMYGMSGSGYIGFNINRDNISTGAWNYSSDGAHNGSNLIYGNLYGDMIFSVKPHTGAGSGTISDLDVMQNGKMTILSDGKVVIANHSINGWGPGSLPASVDYSSNNYRLFVETGILTEKVRVAIKGTPEWADYVFAKDYKLMPLKQLEEYIEAENHLPEVPSAEEVVKEGIDLGQMQAKLLQKVEELTLYVIQQQKEIDALKKQVSKSKK